MHCLEVPHQFWTANSTLEAITSKLLVSMCFHKCGLGVISWHLDQNMFDTTKSKAKTDNQN